MHLQKKYDPDLGFTTVKGMSRAEAAKASAGVKLVKSDDERAADFARFLIAQALGKGNLALAHSIGESRYAANSNVVSALRSAVAAGTTTGESWAEPLSDYRNLASEFIEWLRPQTILGRFGKNGIPSLRQVPFNVKIPRQLSGGKASFVAEGHAKPVTKFDFGTITLGHAKIATIAVITEELARFSAPSAEALIRDQLAAALIEEMDRSFIDPLRAAVANISPASVTYGVDPVESSGTDADAVRQDVKAVLSRYIAANVTPSSAVWVMPTLTALSLSLMTNGLGQAEFPNISMGGGMLAGLPVITSDFLAAGNVALINTKDILLADDGVVNVDSSNTASLQMDDDPDHNSVEPVGTALVSMFQTNSIAVRAERFVNWAKRRESAAQLITGVEWGDSSSLLS